MYGKALFQKMVNQLPLQKSKFLNTQKDQDSKNTTINKNYMELKEQVHLGGYLTYITKNSSPFCLYSGHA